MRRESIPALLLAILLTIVLVAMVPVLHLQWGVALIPIVSCVWLAVMLVSSMGARSRQPPEGLG